jgi:hypothetical protein
MNCLKLTQKLSNTYYEELLRISEESNDPEFGKNNEETSISKKFSLSSSSGKQLYRSLSDEQLLHVITESAKRLGHSPAQKEIFWVWREYIKLRYKKWPYALMAAGLPKNAGNGGTTLEELSELKQKRALSILEIRERAKVLGRIPHPGDMPQLVKEMSKMNYAWQEIIQEAVLNQDFFIKYSLYKIDGLEEDYQYCLQRITEQAKTLGRAPMRNEVDADMREKLINRCGSWRNALYQIGLEPVTKIRPFSSVHTHNCNYKKLHHQNTLFDCYYRVLNLDDQCIEDLIFVKEMADRLHHMPQKAEVSPEIRKHLQKSCGSWANALYQLQYLEKNEKFKEDMKNVTMD